MNPLLEKLHDIEGLDSISWWPLAIGWWMMIVIGLFIICCMGWLLVRRIAFKCSWKHEAVQKLSYLEKNLTKETARETVLFLSEYLRRIALQRFSRHECAGLVGEEWLKWLTVHDPKNFNWEQKGKLLLEVPYAPLTDLVPTEPIQDLIKAIKNWVY